VSVPPDLDSLAPIIKEVKPSIGDHRIALTDSLVDDLGLDSLDLLQLARRIRRDFKIDFDVDEWLDASGDHNRSVGSLLEMTGSA
jgi:acyl carrier protein